MKEFTPEKSHMNVNSVTSVLAEQKTLKNTEDSTLKVTLARGCPNVCIARVRKVTFKREGLEAVG